MQLIRWCGTGRDGDLTAVSDDRTGDFAPVIVFGAIGTLNLAATLLSFLSKISNGIDQTAICICLGFSFLA